MKSDVLDPAAIRRRVASIPGVKEVPLPSTNSAKDVLSLLVGLDDDSGENLARLHIYTQTRSVCVARVLHGRVRQVFRRHLTIDAVERLVRDPPSWTRIDRELVSLDDVTNSLHQQWTMQQQVELADVGLAILQAEREKLQNQLETLVNEEEEEAPVTTLSKSKSQSTPSTMGVEFQFSLEADCMTHVDQCLREISNLAKRVQHVSINGKAALFCYGNGGVAYTPAIPRPMHYELTLLRNHKGARPYYGALGTRERYYLALQDGSYRFKGPKRLEDELQKYPGQLPLSVAFGSTFDTYFVVHHNHSYAYQGKSVPKGLLEKLTSRNDQQDLQCVSLGPAGEWFLRAQNGRLWWGNLSNDLDDALSDLLDDGHSLCFLDFGAEESYFISYDDG